MDRTWSWYSCSYRQSNYLEKKLASWVNHHDCNKHCLQNIISTSPLVKTPDCFVRPMKAVLIVARVFPQQRIPDCTLKISSVCYRIRNLDDCLNHLLSSNILIDINSIIEHRYLHVFKASQIRKYDRPIHKYTSGSNSQPESRSFQVTNPKRFGKTYLTGPWPRRNYNCFRKI